MNTVVGNFFIVWTIENEKELCIWVCSLLFYFFVLYAKSGSTKKITGGLSDISYQNLFSRDLNDIKKFSQC